MYPTVVIVLVETQRSMVNVCEIGTSNASKLARPMASEPRPAALGRLSFVLGPVHGTTDSEEAESQRSRALQSQGGQEHSMGEVIHEVKEHQVSTTLSSG